MIPLRQRASRHSYFRKCLSAATGSGSKSTRMTGEYFSSPYPVPGWVSALGLIAWGALFLGISFMSLLLIGPPAFIDRRFRRSSFRKSRHGNDPHGGIISPGAGIRPPGIGKVKGVHLIIRTSPPIVIPPAMRIEDIHPFLGLQKGLFPGNNVAPVDGNDQTHPIRGVISNSDTVPFPPDGFHIGPDTYSVVRRLPDTAADRVPAPLPR